MNNKQTITIVDRTLQEKIELILENANIDFLGHKGLSDVEEELLLVFREELAKSEGKETHGE